MSRNYQLVYYVAQKWVNYRDTGVSNKSSVETSDGWSMHYSQLILLIRIFNFITDRNSRSFRNQNGSYNYM